METCLVVLIVPLRGEGSQLPTPRRPGGAGEPQAAQPARRFVLPRFESGSGQRRADDSTVTTRAQRSGAPARWRREERPPHLPGSSVQAVSDFTVSPSGAVLGRRSTEDRA